MGRAVADPRLRPPRRGRRRLDGRRRPRRPARVAVAGRRWRRRGPGDIARWPALADRRPGSVRHRRVGRQRRLREVLQTRRRAVPLRPLAQRGAVQRRHRRPARAGELLDDPFGRGEVEGELPRCVVGHRRRRSHAPSRRDRLRRGAGPRGRRGGGRRPGPGRRRRDVLRDRAVADDGQGGAAVAGRGRRRRAGGRRRCTGEADVRAAGRKGLAGGRAVSGVPRRGDQPQPPLGAHTLAPRARPSLAERPGAGAVVRLVAGAGPRGGDRRGGDRGHVPPQRAHGVGPVALVSGRAPVGIGVPPRSLARRPRRPDVGRCEGAGRAARHGLARAAAGLAEVHGT
mmetsp:Transcript_52148/g.158438  ORF Transcript_52148/g.158438 Transcript_52148/m.158438 type:complete len:342 (-) Transcript_52148:404-1429(-)